MGKLSLSERVKRSKQRFIASRQRDISDTPLSSFLTEQDKFSRAKISSAWKESISDALANRLHKPRVKRREDESKKSLYAWQRPRYGSHKKRKAPKKTLYDLSAHNGQMGEGRKKQAYT